MSVYYKYEVNATPNRPRGQGDDEMRTDGLDNPLSPNGPAPRYYVVEDDGRRHGPYSCPREAELAAESEMATIVDHRGREVAHG